MLYFIPLENNNIPISYGKISLANRVVFVWLRRVRRAAHRVGAAAGEPQLAPAPGVWPRAARRRRARAR